MKYRISTVGKIKSNDEDIITRKYLQRIKNIEPDTFAQLKLIEGIRPATLAVVASDSY